MLESIFSLNVLWWLILLLYVPCCLGLILIVLLQKGKGVGFAGAFGVGGGGDTLFGPRSARSLPQKLTYFAAAVFMVMALVMSTLSGKMGRGSAPDLVGEVAAPATALDRFFDDASTEEAPEAVGAKESPAADAEADAVADITEAPQEELADAPAEDTPTEEPATAEPETAAP